MPHNNPQLNGAPEMVRTMIRSHDVAKDHRSEQITLEHLLYAILEEQDVLDTLKKMKIDPEAMKEKLAVFIGGGFLGNLPNGHSPEPTKAFQDVMTLAIGRGVISQPRGGRAMPIHILIQLSEYPLNDSFAINVLNDAGLDSLSLKRFLSHGDASSPMMGGGMDEMMAPAKEINTVEDAVAFLAKFCANLNEVAEEGGIDPLIGREEEVGAIIQIAARRTKNNVALIGEPGVGKTAIAEGLARKIVEGQVPDTLLGAEVFSLDIGSLMAGTRFRGDLEERMKNIIKALSFIDHPILFIDEIHTIMGSGSGSGQSGSLDIANLLKPALSKGTLRCIGSTTYEEYRKYFEKDRALLRRFKRVDVREPDAETAKLILRGLRDTYAEFHGVTYTDAAIDAAVDLTHRYVTNALLPDKAIDVIDNAGARQRVTPDNLRVSVIDVAQVEYEVSRVAKIPEQSVKEDESHKLLRLEDDLKKAVFGQDSALSALADAVFVSRSGLRETNKPAGCFMFAGPTGVGKTEAARQLADTLGVPLLKFDMSEYMEKHSVSKLIGSPPGYVGFGDGGSGSGKLVNEIDANPYSVLLLDEIEKAHPDVYNVFLQVMDDGKLTSSGDKTVDFRNVIIIMTTNAGARELTRKGIGFSSKDQVGDPTTEINRMFSPEFRNRLDAIIQFARLTQENIQRVVDKFIAVLAVQALQRNVVLQVSDEAKARLSKIGYDPDMGARPLNRAINDHVKKPLSRLMVVGNLRNGGTAYVGIRDGEIVVQEEPIAANDELIAA